MTRVLNSRSEKPGGRSPKAPTRPRKQAIQARSRETVEVILRATAHILVREGYERMSTNRVAQAAGVSIGSLYQYFPSKEALVAALLEQHIEHTLGVIRREAPSMLGMPVEAAVTRFVELMIASHRVDPELHRVFAEQLPRIGDFARVEASIHEGIALAKNYLLVHADEIVPTDHDLTAFMMVTTVEALTHAAVLSRPDLLDEPKLVAEISAVVVRYLKG